ncbi:hypothetical protein [Kamptonema sp. UHCC 0994]|uniref:hypothetical protein n=1 Tax=Kamptonema sp. UHCC 0994 TaxID=3031329 RepID=UPI0023BA0C1F|nr:hypothetical protein [Kamptonema sp. UHCC 0994]MDF0551694.1 hypothetical protein [Kamptonema sp. UHCC 0994]
MGLVLDLQNPNNWESRWEFNVQASGQVFRSNGEALSWDPIPEQTCPLLLHNPFVAVYCESATKRNSWQFGGYLVQKFSTGLIVGGSPNAVTTNGRKVFFNRLQLLRLNDYTADYSLSFKPPFWHRDIKLTVWEYTAEIITTVEAAIEDINDVQIVLSNKLQNIESKIDLLL